MKSISEVIRIICSGCKYWYDIGGYHRALLILVAGIIVYAIGVTWEKMKTIFFILVALLLILVILSGMGCTRVPKKSEHCIPTPTGHGYSICIKELL